MEEMSLILGIITDIFTIILLIVGITIGIRMIALADKADKILDNVEEKVNSLNGIFNVVNKASLGLETMSSKITGTIASLFGRVFKKKKEEEDNE